MNLAMFPTVPQPSARVRCKNILFATDLGGASAPAQVYSVLLAHKLGSHVYVLHTGSGLSSGPMGAQPLSDEARKPDVKKIEALRTFFDVSGVAYTLLLESGEVRNALARAVEDYSIDLIIVGSHGRTGISHFMGSIAEDVARSMTCPVMTVGPQALSGFANPLRHILFATDFSEESKLALPYAISLAQEFDSKLHMLHVASKPECFAHGHEQVGDYLLNRLKRMAPQGQFPWCSITYEVRCGDPAREIPRMASDGRADLIVVGLHAAVRFTSHLPERLSYSVLCKAPCPVLSILPQAGKVKLAQVPTEFLPMAQRMN